MQKTSKRTPKTVATLICWLALIAITAWSCSPSSYDVPAETQATTTLTPTALISAETLKSWMDQGLVNGQGEYDRVVILDVTFKTKYDTEHIPGAIFLDNTSELQPNRVEGVAPSAQMVMDGAGMDALIKRAGIDEHTTIVFTNASTDSAFQATRGYVTFRYWGIPKNRLKALDGYDFAWKLASYPTTTEVPAVTVSNYSVTPRGINRVRTDLRASLGEMIAAVKRLDADTLAGTPSSVIIEGRSASTSGAYAGSAGATPGVFAPTGDYVTFEGHMKNGVALLWSTLHDSTTKEYLPEAERSNPPA